MWFGRYKYELGDVREQPIFTDYDHEAVGYFLDKNYGALHRFFKGGIFERGSNHLRNVRGQQAIYFGNHQSMVDNFLVTSLFHRYLGEDDFPRIIAGHSLDSSFLQNLYGFDFNKAGVCWFDRDKKAEGDIKYMNRWGLAVGRELRKGKSYMIFPEGTRSLYRNGDIGEGDDVGFEKLVSGSRSDPYIITLSFNYDHPVEEFFAPVINWGRKKHWPVVQTLANWVYKTTDATAFLTRRWVPKTGEARVAVNEPVKLSEIIGRRGGKQSAQDLRNFVRLSILTNYNEIEDRKGHNDFNPL